jgi:hypothetical protein
MMTLLLNRMPFTAEPYEIAVCGESVLIRANQIILWISLTLQRISEPNPSAVHFPAILDTGLNHSFSIRAQHLINWAGLRPEALEVVGAVRDRGQRLVRRAINIWVHPNEPGERARLAPGHPVLIKADDGMAVYPDGEFPRLPIFGLQAIADNHLYLSVNGRRREATLRTSSNWWWPFV